MNNLYRLESLLVNEIIQVRKCCFESLFYVNHFIDEDALDCFNSLLALLGYGLICLFGLSQSYFSAFMPGIDHFI